MKTVSAAMIATLLCAGAALAQDPLGDDSGPNANDGACDDSRFENMGTGNSNIVQWEGGRYDRRDASDCRKLLLQGLINWRDGVDPGVDAALATGNFGVDTGPNANDGQCDDGRFENIGAGNSNIVLWEGGLYDGRDATDCADLLLRGLIAWKRDDHEVNRTVVSTPQVPTVVSLGARCGEDYSSGHDCWVEVPGHSGCYAWFPVAAHMSGYRDETSSFFPPYGGGLFRDYVWEGQCRNGLAHGHWALTRDGEVVQGPFVKGKRHGRWTCRTTSEDPEFAYDNREGEFANGRLHGVLRVSRLWYGDVQNSERRWVNGERIK